MPLLNNSTPNTNNKTAMMMALLATSQSFQLPDIASAPCIARK